MSKFIDSIGQRFGRLTVIRRMNNDKWGKTRWLCQCDCELGKEIIVLGNHLRSGRTKSCGCLVAKHGHSKRGQESPIYRAWRHILDRCTNSDDKDYKNYGGRGITVCEEWRKFPNFLNDMKKNWEPGLTLERRKNELGYFPGNCYWATRKQQQRNTRRNLYIPYNGENRLFIELCEEYNMPYHTVYDRIYKLGWSAERALTTPVRKRK